MCHVPHTGLWLMGVQGTAASPSIAAGSPSCHTQLMGMPSMGHPGSAQTPWHRAHGAMTPRSQGPQGPQGPKQRVPSLRSARFPAQGPQGSQHRECPQQMQPQRPRKCQHFPLPRTQQSYHCLGCGWSPWVPGTAHCCDMGPILSTRSCPTQDHGDLLNKSSLSRAHLNRGTKGSP